MKFIFIVTGVFVLFHISAHYALIKPMLADLPRRYKILGDLFLLCNFVALACYILFRHNEIPSLIVVILSISILVGMLLFVASVINIPFLFIFKKSQKKRIFVSRILFLIAILCVFWGVFTASRMPQITTQDIFVKNLKKEVKILQIADLHLSNLISKERVADIVNLANSTNPDIIVLVGDIIDEEESKIKAHLSELKRLKAKFGVYFVLGNHEFLFDAQKSLEIIENLGIRALVNENVIIDDNINLSGISDAYGNVRGIFAPSISQTLNGANDALPTILLAHRPSTISLLKNGRDSADLDSAQNSAKDSTQDSAPKVDVMLSGHTHGGQIAPFSLLVYLANPFLYGLKTLDGIQVYITQGAHLAVTFGRIGTKAEINLITLKKEKK